MVITILFINSRFCIPENELIREILAKGQNRNDFRNAIMHLKIKYLPYHLGQLPWNNNQNGKISVIKLLYKLNHYNVFIM